MANDSVSVSGPIKVVSDAKERVALELMQQISYLDSENYETKNRAYYLTLYNQCWKAANGNSIDNILKPS